MSEPTVHHSGAAVERLEWMVGIQAEAELSPRRVGER